MKKTIWLRRLPSGAYMEYGRHCPLSRRQGWWRGGARAYTGEAAEVIKLVIEHTGGHRGDVRYAEVRGEL